MMKNPSILGPFSGPFSCWRPQEFLDPRLYGTDRDFEDRTIFFTKNHEKTLEVGWNHIGSRYKKLVGCVIQVSRKS